MFLAEGAKLAEEILHSHLRADKVYANAQWLERSRHLLEQKKIEFSEVTELEMKHISTLTTPSEVLVVAELPEEKLHFPQSPKLVLALDGIRDPGNMGTIIRLADWYGMKEIYCSPDCTDAYSPKVVQATMGSIVRVQPMYLPLEEVFKHLPVPIYTAVLDGEVNVHDMQQPEPAILVIGSESHGVSEAVALKASQTLSIPGYGGAESLNAAVAAGILLDNFSRMWKGSLGDNA